MAKRPRDNLAEVLRWMRATVAWRFLSKPGQELLPFADFDELVHSHMLEICERIQGNRKEYEVNPRELYSATIRWCADELERDDEDGD